MNRWNWSAKRTSDGRRGLDWLGALAVAVPFITVLLLALMMFIVDGRISAVGGVAFSLPEGDMTDSVRNSLVVMMMPKGSETLIFFDDTRYTMADASSVESFSAQFSRRLTGSIEKSVLVLADEHVGGGELMRLAEVVRKCGAAKVLFAERREGAVQ